MNRNEFKKELTDALIELKIVKQRFDVLFNEGCILFENEKDFDFYYFDKGYEELNTGFAELRGFLHDLEEIDSGI